MNFFNYGIKSGLTYKISGRNFVTGNLMYATRAPEANNIFVSQRSRNDLVSNIKSEEVISGDVNYYAKYPDFKLRITYYYTQINNQIWLKTYWHENYNTSVDFIMKGVNQNHQGVEIGLEKNILNLAVLIISLTGYEWLKKHKHLSEFFMLLPLWKMHVINIYDSL